MTRGAGDRARPGPDPALVPDREIWARLQGGADEQALTELVNRHVDTVYNFAFRRTSSWSVAEEVVQETFTALWRRAVERGLDDLAADSAVPVLLRIAAYQAGNALRSKRRLSQLRTRLWFATAGEVAPDAGTAAAGNVDSERAMRKIRRLLAKLPAGQREVVELVSWAGCSTAEAAEALGVAEGTVKSRLARARRRLADLDPLEELR